MSIPEQPRPSAVVQHLCALVSEYYVFADVGDVVCDRLRARLVEAAYDGLDEVALAAAVTSDLQHANGDRHLRLVHHAQELVDENDDQRDDAEMAAAAAACNHGVARVERTTDGIGVLAIGPTLFPPSIAAETVGAAFTELSGVRALVLDLSGCRGGDPEMVQFVCTYLFGRDAVHLNDIVEQGGRHTRQFWTLPYVPGRRLGPTTPVWVVTGPDTFSGGEELAYDLQQLNRATLVGATTRGGAHPRMGFRLGPHLEAHVPVARTVNPWSGTNWEGVGVVPDAASPADEALDLALALAATHLVASADSGSADITDGRRHRGPDWVTGPGATATPGVQTQDGA